MLRNGYQYAIVIYGTDGTLLDQTPIEVDWEPAEEWARFEALRRGLPARAELRAASILPLWNVKREQPYVRGFRVDLDDGEASSDFDLTYFQDLARVLIAGLVERGVLAVDGRHDFRYRVVAFETTHSGTPPAVGRTFTIERITPALELHGGSLAEFIAGSPPGGAPSEEVQVFVPAAVVEEVAGLTRATGDRETGGVLIGHVHRDPYSGDLFLEVTAQIPARHARGDLDRLSFRPADWTEVQAALDLRRQGEVLLGWWHCHLARLLCKNCPPESQRHCSFATGTFSAYDRHLHRTVFPRAYSVALVVNDAAAGLSYSMFGWHRGRVEPRGFRILDHGRPPRGPGMEVRHENTLSRSRITGDPAA
jgi:hypothetical protein